MNNRQMENQRIDWLKGIASTVRKSLLRTSSTCKIPHVGSCMSCMDILVFLYWYEMQLDTEDPAWDKRDRFILSKGHAAPALIQVLAHRGYFSLNDLELFGKDGSYFHEHPPVPGLIPGIEAATGSLGHGLPMAVGMSLAQKINEKDVRTYAVVGDGECNEGSIWECAMFAASNALERLTVFVDLNRWQATDRSSITLGADSLCKKWEAFGWHTQEICGHSFEEIEKAIANAKADSGRPSVIVANTIKGKGVSFMEDDNNWHYRTPSPEELASALAELEVVR